MGGELLLIVSLLFVIMKLCQVGLGNIVFNFFFSFFPFV